MEQAIISMQASSARNDFALAMVKQDAAAVQALAKLLETVTESAKAILGQGIGGALDISA